MTLAGAARRVIAVSVTALALALLARVSAAPLPFHEGTTARLRLSWSARPERIEVCRTLSVEHARRARAAIPAHLALDTTLAIAARQVLVVTFAPEHRTLVLLAGGNGPR